MIQEQFSEIDRTLWGQFVESEMTFFNYRKEFLNNCSDRVELIRQALHKPTQRGTALRILYYLNEEERQGLFKDLLELASVSHADIHLCRKAILMLQREWLLANIETTAEPLLREGTDEEYRRLLELYFQIDRQLTKRLMRRALEHEDEDIREAGEDFRDILVETAIAEGNSELFVAEYSYPELCP